jgi:hypothetical protein
MFYNEKIAYTYVKKGVELLRVLHIQGKKLVEVTPSNGKYEFLNGDVLNS